MKYTEEQVKQSIKEAFHAGIRVGDWEGGDECAKILDELINDIFIKLDAV